MLRDLKLEIFSLKRDEAGLEEILVLVASLATKHALPETISQCLRSLVHCASSGPDSLQVQISLAGTFACTFPNAVPTCAVDICSRQ